MFQPSKKTNNSNIKCYVTQGKLGHVDPKQPPVKRKPFASLLNQPFVHRAELILPSGVYEIVRDELEKKLSKPVYSRVIMSLSAVVEGSFFNEYIKKGNIHLLSRGRLGIDDVFSLHSGILTLHLSRSTYERCGLPGKPFGPKGSRNGKPHWIVEINLRLPSMVRGKKGFDRVVYAFREVLVEEVEWLFCDLRGIDITLDPLAKYHPVQVTVTPIVSGMTEITIPELKPGWAMSSSEEWSTTEYPDDFSDYATELYEWLSLISLGSSRIITTDQIDPFLSRYTPPAPSSSNLETCELVKVTWSGFLSSKWIHETFLRILLVVNTPESGDGDGKERPWFSYGICGFHGSWSSDSRDVVVLKLPGEAPGEYISWDVAQQ